MRILLDESLPRDLKGLLANHEAETVALAGWAGVKNGKLLALAATAYDVFLTADQNIEFQQNLAKLPVSILVMVLVNNRIETIAQLLPQVLVALDQLQPKKFIKVGGKP
jgi:predicted nuclease of predicted toxin-antitoxin system